MVNFSRFLGICTFGLVIIFCNFSHAQKKSPTPTSCPKGSILYEKVCALEPSCPSGMIFNLPLNICEVKPVCPSGTVVTTQAGTCVTYGNCPKSNILPNGTCGINVTCPSAGGTFSAKSSTCTYPASCPSGTTFNSAQISCVSPVAPSCPAGTTPHPTKHFCLA